ncbi:hypothetical protein [Kibdelosporangium philippinense]|uniref:hypothetical protein n=1 Tax=Kibdelosporangium philippinense TaxID=211113 RepID=UPI0036070616
MRRICTNGQYARCALSCQQVAHSTVKPVAASGHVLGEHGLADPRLAGGQTERSATCPCVGERGGEVVRFRHTANELCVHQPTVRAVPRSPLDLSGVRWCGAVTSFCCA